MKILTLNEYSDSLITVYHGGNLDNFNKTHIIHDPKRIKYGYGLYTVDNIETAIRYSKEDKGDKLYKITLEKGNEVKYIDLYVESCRMLIKMYGVKSKLAMFNKYAERLSINGMINAELFYNFCFNNKVIPKQNTPKLMDFFKANDIDYDIVDSVYSENEKVYIIINLDKIINIKEIPFN